MPIPLESSGLLMVGWNAFVQSDSKILWSSLSHEVKHCFDFLHGVIYQGKVACEATNFDWVCLATLNHTPTFSDLPGVPWVVLGHFKVENNLGWKISKFWSKLNLFLHQFNHGGSKDKEKQRWKTTVFWQLVFSTRE